LRRRSTPPAPAGEVGHQVVECGDCKLGEGR
jgi:hypothetical protein